MAERTFVRPEKGVSDGAGVLAALTGAYQRGWQPADIIHITRRSLGAPEVRLAAWAIRHDARMSRAAARAPRSWAHQVSTISSLPSVAGALDASPLHRTSLTYLWRHLPRLPHECPPPSEWPLYSFKNGAGLEPAPPTVEPKVLIRIRGLLAKAERTEFAEEAETFTAKAQELMTKHAVGTALLNDDRHGPQRVHVGCRRFHLENPYLKEKAQLLSEIGKSNGVRTVWFSKLAMATTIGTPMDLDQVELLFNSLQVQATHALGDAAQHRPSPSSTAFRRAFLYGFAVRIGQRLRQAGRQATQSAVQERRISAADAAPVLARHADAVDAELARLFPSMRHSRDRPTNRPGLHAGNAAADEVALIA